jgi:hypothetical protein
MHLRLSALSYQQQAAFGVSAFDRLVYFQVSGFSWENNSYNINKKTLIAGAIVGCNNDAGI